jgi:hypothetical protein
MNLLPIDPDSTCFSTLTRLSAVASLTRLTRRTSLHDFNVVWVECAFEDDAAPGSSAPTTTTLTNCVTASTAVATFEDDAAPGSSASSAAALANRITASAAIATFDSDPSTHRQYDETHNDKENDRPLHCPE